MRERLDEEAESKAAELAARLALEAEAAEKAAEAAEEAARKAKESIEDRQANATEAVVEDVTNLKTIENQLIVNKEVVQFDTNMLLIAGGSGLFCLCICTCFACYFLRDYHRKKLDLEEQMKM